MTALSGVAGLLAGVLSVVALGLTALLGPVLGLLALLAQPLRALARRLSSRRAPG